MTRVAWVFLFLVFVISCGWSDADQLFVSSREGDLAKVEQLLSKGVDPNHRFNHLQRDFQPYESPIITAAEHGHLDVVKALVKSGADIEFQNTYTSETALYMAVKNKHRDVIEYLLSVGADPNVQNNESFTPLMLAIEQNDFELIKLLRAYGAWPDPTVMTTRLIEGEVARDAISMARVWGRPYVGYLQNLKSTCIAVFRTRKSCATKTAKRLTEKNKALEF